MVFSLHVYKYFSFSSVRKTSPETNHASVSIYLSSKSEGFTIALLYYNVTIKTSIKILLFNARDHGRSAGTKQLKLTENRSKHRINLRKVVE